MLKSPPRYTRSDLPPLDEADRKLIDILQQDGRASGRKLAQETGLSEANVSRRLARLMEEQTIRVRCFVPPGYLGLSFQSALFIRAASDLEKLSEKLKASGGTYWISATFGLYDLVAFCCVPTASEMLTIVDETVMSCSGVRAVTVAPMLEFYTPRFHISPGEVNRSGARRAAPRALDTTDLAIVRELQRDGRLSYADLAQRTGISATSAADRFRRLSTDGLIDVSTIVDPPRLGLELSGGFLIATNGPLRPIMRRLGELKQLYLFTVLAGEFSAYVAFNCRDDREYVQLRAQVLAIEGVRDVQPLLYGRLFHESFDWGAKPAQPAAATSAAGSNHTSTNSAPAAVPSAGSGAGHGNAMLTPARSPFSGRSPS